MNAGRNAGAPKVAYNFNAEKRFHISDHYTDAVRDTARMNNIAQHFVTTWLDHDLKEETEKAAYFDLVEDSNAGVWSVDADGTGDEDHSSWKGFPEGTAKGLIHERRRAGA